MKGNNTFIALLLLPLLLITGCFLYYPFVSNLLKSFYNTNGFTLSHFIGVDNYVRLYKDPIIRKATLNTLQIMVYIVVFQIGIGLLLATMVSYIKRGRSFFRITFFFPIIVSGSAIGLLFVLIYGYNFGLLNALLVQLGFGRVLWINEHSSLIAVAVPTVWHYVGFYFLIMLTAIMKIPDEFNEAANLQGVTGLRKIVVITIPLIWNEIRTSIILAVTGALKVFELVYIITKGGPYNTSEMLGTYMYRKTFTDQAIGYGSTIAMFIVVLGLVLSLILNRALKREEFTY
jgi:raffinose/stachyose/melibiose transport system permease protein